MYCIICLHHAVYSKLVKKIDSLADIHNYSSGLQAAEVESSF